MQKKRNFLELPGEIRNHIYEDYMQATACSMPDQRTRLEELSRVADRTIFEILLALGLQRYFPFILANKQVMHEAFAFCLGACNFVLPEIDQVSAGNGQRLDIGPLATHVRSLHANFFDMRSKALVPFRLNCLQSFFPHLQRLRIEIDDETPASLQVELKTWLVHAEWSSLREVEIIHPELDNRLAEAELDYYLMWPHRAGTRLRRPPSADTWDGPFSLPWAVEMDLLLLDKVNSDVDHILRKSWEARLEKRRNDRLLRYRGFEWFRLWALF